MRFHPADLTKSSLRLLHFVRNDIVGGQGIEHPLFHFGCSALLLLPAGVPLRSYSLREFRFAPGRGTGKKVYSWRLKWRYAFLCPEVVRREGHPAILITSTLRLLRFPRNDNKLCMLSLISLRSILSAPPRDGLAG